MRDARVAARGARPRRRRPVHGARTRWSGDGEEDEIYHLARRSFTLNGRSHELLLLRLLTAELRRQEVQTWKKVIRVISHELNNSLAPVGSLANSASELLRRGQTERLPDILATIGERTRHLQSFIEGYAKFAKLPAPRRETMPWPRFVEGLRSQIAFAVAGPAAGRAAELRRRADGAGAVQPAQERARVGLAARGRVRSPCAASPGGFVDRSRRTAASGMTETVMSNALVPFYSTKRSGTGLGLALAREIVEAHGGRITISNRDGGGIAVGLILPS